MVPVCTQGGLGSVRSHRRGSSTPRNELAAAWLSSFRAACIRVTASASESFQVFSLQQLLHLGDRITALESTCQRLRNQLAALSGILRDTLSEIVSRIRLWF